tara:strand:- start:2831 stop:3463 length:633 start_codon:yes stop_codon:yes gene_type:complete
MDIDLPQCVDRIFRECTLDGLMVHFALFLMQRIIKEIQQHPEYGILKDGTVCVDTKGMVGIFTLCIALAQESAHQDIEAVRFSKSGNSQPFSYICRTQLYRNLHISMHNLKCTFFNLFGIMKASKLLVLDNKCTGAISLCKCTTGCNFCQNTCIIIKDIVAPHGLEGLAAYEAKVAFEAQVAERMDREWKKYFSTTLDLTGMGSILTATP